MNYDKIFIGREKEIKWLSNEVFFADEDSYGSCCSLVGLNNIGKTALIRHMSEEFELHQPENTFYFDTILEEGTDFTDFWVNLLGRFSKRIRVKYLASLFDSPTMSQENALEMIEEAYNFVNYSEIDRSSTIYKSQLIVHLNDIFRHYTTLGVRIIITIDEFDRAKEIFSDGQFFQRLFSLTPKGSGKRLNLSIITISRRRVSTIAHHMQAGSNFEDAYPPMVLKGFTNSDIEEYFALYRALPSGELSEDKKKQVLYLCGRSPGLLMGFLRKFEMICEETTDVGAVYAEHGQLIKIAYENMINLMEDSYADRECLRPLSDVFIQHFIGPVYDDNFDMELPLLYDHGFVTKATDSDNIFIKSGVSEVDVSTESFIYEPIAPYFLEYIKYMVLPNKLANISGMLIKAEKLTRDIIQKEMSAAFPDNWEEIINAFAEKKDYYLEALIIRALQNDFSSSSISKLNVISFNEYYYIMSHYWNLFSKYFSSYADKNAVYDTMIFLNSVRNDSAHLNLAVHNGESRRKIREICTAYIDSIESQTENEISAPMPDPKIIEEWVSVGKSVVFCCESIKKPKGNLRGTIKGYNYSAGIAKSNLGSFGFSRPPKPGDEIEAVVARWDAGAKMFNLKARDCDAGDIGGV